MPSEKYKKIEIEQKKYQRTILWNYLVLQPRGNEENEWCEDYFSLVLLRGFPILCVSPVLKF